MLYYLIKQKIIMNLLKNQLIFEIVVENFVNIVLLMLLVISDLICEVVLLFVCGVLLLCIFKECVI